MKSYTYFANWKMNFSTQDSINFAKFNHEDLLKLAKNLNNEIVICPSFLSIYSLLKIFDSSEVKIGAQNCSRFMEGNFTGEVSAKYLKEIGCSHCIIGHSERRKYNNETDTEILEKFINLTKLNISPILCIGETLEEYKNNNTLNILKSQLNLLIECLISGLEVPKRLSIYIAYEPVWAIGTGIVANNEHLNKVFTYIKNSLQKVALDVNWKLIYGGSINGENIKSLKKLNLIEGFLIGGSSLHFQELKKIVDLD